jgi:predicted nuclease of restriction endonuclease-like RecB superfamily
VKGVVRKGELVVKPLDAAARTRALELATLFVALAEEHVGQTRDVLAAALADVEVEPQDHWLGLALKKLVDDHCVFDVDESLEPETLRSAIFLEAAVRRRAATFDRDAILDDAAAARQTTRAAVDAALFGDLKGCHVLRSTSGVTAQALIDGYDAAQVQAVLLRATRITALVRCASSDAYRALFSRLKFLQLLPTIEPMAEGYSIVIDGPMSLFEQATRYGLKLAMVLPALEACTRYELTADVRWGEQRKACTFRWRGGTLEPTETPPMRDDVAELLTGINALEAVWKAAPASAIVPLPGVGVCVPDLVLTHDDTGEQVFVEVLGFWSRAAVWKRVELVQAGLPTPIVFAVSARLRVSEAALDVEEAGALYVYKGTIHPRRLLARVEELSARSRPAPKEKRKRAKASP